jgi:hypothetical protein
VKPTQWFTLGTAIAACALASGIYLATQRGGPDAVNSRPAPDKAPPARSRTASRHTTAPVSADALRSAARPAPGSQPRATVHDPLRVTGSPPSGQRHISDAEWFARAAKVEREANHELAGMTESLGLTADQQRRIFGVLARGSAAWLPGMKTDVEPSPDASTDPLDYLTAEQYDDAVQEELDRQEWWAEVLPTLMPPETDTGTAVPETPAVPDSPPDSKAIDD